MLRRIFPGCARTAAVACKDFRSNNSTFSFTWRYLSTAAKDITSSAPVNEAEYEKEIADIEKDYEERRKRKQAMIGVVVSDKCSKSVTIKVEHEKYFSKYDKFVTRSKKFMAHDEEEKCAPGDIVRIVPCRPRSKRKRHEVIDILKKAQQLDLSV
jgi:small subunit ribosomal protein S17